MDEYLNPERELKKLASESKKEGFSQNDYYTIAKGFMQYFLSNMDFYRTLNVVRKLDSLVAERDACLRSGVSESVVAELDRSIQVYKNLLKSFRDGGAEKRFKGLTVEEMVKKVESEGGVVGENK